MKWQPEPRRPGLRGDPYEPPFQRHSVAEREEFFRLADEYRATLREKAKTDRGNARLRKPDLDTLAVLLATHGPFTNRELATLCGCRDLTKFRMNRLNVQIRLGLMESLGANGVICYRTTPLGHQLVGLQSGATTE